MMSDIIQLSIPWITKTIIDGLAEQTLTKPRLIRWGLFVLFLSVVLYACKQIWRHLILGAARLVESKLREQLLNTTLHLTNQTASETDNGKFLALASSDIPSVGQSLAFGVAAFFDSIFITSVAFVLMFQLSPTLTAYAIAPFPVLALLMVMSLRVIYRKYDQVQQSVEELTEKVRESLSGIRTLRAYEQAHGDLEQFQAKSQDYRSKNLSYARVDAFFAPLILLFAGSSSAVLLYFGGQLVINNSLSIGTLAAFIGYLALLTWPMIAAGWMLVLLQRGTASLARIDEILKSPQEANELPCLEFDAPPRLTVTNLDFSYPDGTKALHDWSFSLEQGQILGIVGSVGSGKSTFLKLLQLLETPPPNSIFLDGRDISTHSPKSVRGAFSYVNQEPFLFSDSIKNNLLMANPRSTESDLVEKLKTASLTDDLSRFPDGIETHLGERGISLSGGQKQRAALARALLKPAPILLLDDTLSAVDTITEQQIIEALSENSRNRSTILISHRLSAIKRADLILVIEDGNITSRGTHSELLAEKGLYFDLFCHQVTPGEQTVD